MQFFLHMRLVGDMTQYASHINPHFDSGDIITSKGGSISFYDGLDEKIKEEYIQVLLVNMEGLQ